MRTTSIFSKTSSETFIDRGQLQKLIQPTITASGKRIPGLKLDHPRQLALMHALVRFAHVAAGGTFTTKELHPTVAETLNCSTEDYKLSSLRYELSKLRAKGLVEKIPKSRRYRLLQDGYRLSVVFLKLFEKIYAPLASGLQDPFSGDANLSDKRISNLDKLYLAGTTTLDNLVEAVGLRAA
jgi:DNA-binding transcriptional ArsR family regulator